MTKRADLWLWYSLTMGERKTIAERIIKAFDYDIEAVYSKTAEEISKSVERLLPQDIALLNDKSLDIVEREMYYAKNYGVEIVTFEDDKYPKNLITIATKPYVLYYRGEYSDINDDILISIVGSRTPSNEGRTVARQIAYDLAQNGVTVVSGMAEGIDSEAHMGAINAGGKTIAVLGNGVNKAYPAFNKGLMYNIMNNGLLISEYSFDSQSLKYHFPERNRIIAGLSLGTLVVEATIKSGTSSTVNAAKDEGRDVFAVPGSPKNPLAQGPLNLIKDGAKVVTKAIDILEEYNHLYGEIFKIKQFKKDTLEFEVYNKKDESDVEAAILNAINEGRRTLEELCSYIKTPVSKINSTVTLLELKGKIIKSEDGIGYKVSQ